MMYLIDLMCICSSMICKLQCMKWKSFLDNGQHLMVTVTIKLQDSIGLVRKQIYLRYNVCIVTS